MGEAKVRENRLRRMAERQGLTLRKSRTRDPRALTYDVYWLIDRENNAVVGDGAGMNLDGVEDWLSR